MKKPGRALATLASLGVGCGRAPSGSEAPDASTPPSAPSRAAETASFELAARALARGPSGARFAAKQAWRPRADAFDARSHELSSVAPRVVTAPFEVHVGTIAGVALRPILAEGARDVAAVDEGDAVVYPGPITDGDGGDAVALAGDDAFELAYVLRAVPTSANARYRFSLRALDGATAREDGAGGLDVLDRRGAVRLHMPTPLAIDDAGARREGRAKLDGDALELAFDLSGLRAPIVIDPGFETATWTTKTVTATPPPRYGHGLVYDPVREKSVLMGGYTNSVGYPSNEIWEWDGTAWAKRNDVVLPGNYGYVAATWDAARGVVVVFGGANPGYYNRVQEFDGRVWSYSAPTPSPTARAQSAIAFDARRSVCVMFGGQGPYTGSNNAPWPHNDTWEWNGAWTMKIDRAVAGNPAFRRGAAMGFDVTRGVTVLYGGDDMAGHIFGDTWEYDGTKWTQAAPTASPPPLTHASIVWDSLAKRLVLAGGSSATTCSYDGQPFQGAFLRDSAIRRAVDTCVLSA